MEEKTVQERVINVAAEQLGVEATTLHIEGVSRINEVFDDPRDAFAFVLFLGDEFEIELTDETVDGWQTFADIIAYIESVLHS